jgi:hypothetical protein
MQYWQVLLKGKSVGTIGSLIYEYNQAQNGIKRVPTESVILIYKLPVYEAKENKNTS